MQWAGVAGPDFYSHFHASIHSVSDGGPFPISNACAYPAIGVDDTLAQASLGFATCAYPGSVDDTVWRHHDGSAQRHGACP